MQTDPYLNEYFILRNKLNIDNQKDLSKAENDFAILGIKKLLEEKDYEITVEYLKHINYEMFKDVYEFAGKFRTIHVEKNEEILSGLSVNYAEPEDIERNLNTIFTTISETDFESLTKEEQKNFVSNMIVDIWQTHPFREGNTRGILIFLRKFLEKYNLRYDPTIFKNYGNYDYMRKALVAASFEAIDLNVHKNYSYINRIVSDIIDDAHLRRIIK